MKLGYYYIHLSPRKPGHFPPSEDVPCRQKAVGHYQSCHHFGLLSSNLQADRDPLVPGNPRLCRVRAPLRTAGQLPGHDGPAAEKDEQEASRHPRTALRSPRLNGEPRWCGGTLIPLLGYGLDNCFSEIAPAIPETWTRIGGLAKDSKEA